MNQTSQTEEISEQAEPGSEPEANATELDTFAANDDVPAVWAPMFGQYRAVYEQMVSKSMHDIYNWTGDELREQRWYPIFRVHW